MYVAVLVETDKNEQGAKQQVLVTPINHSNTNTSSGIKVFTRNYVAGQRGRGQAWQEVELSAITSCEPVINEPVAIVINNDDMLSAGMGNVTALSTRLNSTEPVAMATGEKVYELNELVKTVYESMVGGDNGLTTYIRDSRRKNGVTLTPVKELEPAFVQVTSINAEPVMAEPTKPVMASRGSEIRLASVPDKSWSERYINRKVTKGGKTDHEVLDVALAEKQNVLIRGHAGSGKTMCVVSWASARGYRYFNVSSNIGLEPSHLFGMWVPTEIAGQFKWQDGAVTDLVRHGGVLLLNEIDFMPERVTTVLFGLLDDRREIQLLENGGEVIKAHPDLIVIGDHNPSYRGSRPMNQAWKDRFAHKLEFPYDKAIERKLIKSKALLEVAWKLREQFENGEIETPISTRGLEYFVKNAQFLDLDYAIECYINGFADEEKDAVKVVFDTAKVNIARDFGITLDTDTLQADEEN